MGADARADLTTNSATPPHAASDAELLAILAELAREVSSVLDLDALLEKIPNLISRLTDRKSTRLNSSHTDISRMPSSA